jgi:hypothetical protein
MASVSKMARENFSSASIHHCSLNLYFFARPDSYIVKNMYIYIYIYLSLSIYIYIYTHTFTHLTA